MKNNYSLPVVDMPHRDWKPHLRLTPTVYQDLTTGEYVQVPANRVIKFENGVSYKFNETNQTVEQYKTYNQDKTSYETTQFSEIGLLAGKKGPDSKLPEERQGEYAISAEQLGKIFASKPESAAKIIPLSWMTETVKPYEEGKTPRPVIAYTLPRVATRFQETRDCSEFITFSENVMNHLTESRKQIKDPAKLAVFDEALKVVETFLEKEKEALGLIQKPSQPGEE